MAKSRDYGTPKSPLAWTPEPGAAPETGERGPGPGYKSWDRASAPTPAAAPAPLAMKWLGNEVPDELYDALHRIQNEVIGPASNIQAQAAEKRGEDDPLAPVGLENIVGYGIMEKRIGDEYTGTLGITVLVRRKVPSSRIAPSAAIPGSMSVGRTRAEVLTDVVESGVIRPQFACGSSIGNFRVTWGTQGCLVVLNAAAGGHLCVLSNNHILANSNPVGGGFARSVANDGQANADPILSPGPGQGGTFPDDQVGVLDRYVPLRPGGVANFVDAAVAWTAPSVVQARIGSVSNGFRLNPEPIAPAMHMTVRKIGARTGHTLGTIIGMQNLPQVPYQPAGGSVFQVNMEQQLVIEGSGGVPFSQGGDSGSLIVEANSFRPVALLFAGDEAAPFWTYANPISAVLAAPELGLTGGKFVSKLSNE